MKIRLIHSLSIIILFFAFASIILCTVYVTVIFIILHLLFYNVAQIVEHYYPKEYESKCNESCMNFKPRKND